MRTTSSTAENKPKEIQPEQMDFDDIRGIDRNRALTHKPVVNKSNKYDTK